MKKALFPVLLLWLLVGGCKPDVREKGNTYARIEGRTMGTTYHITYENSDMPHLKPEVEQLLKVINQDVSTYIPTAVISKFNQSKTGIELPAGSANHFKINFLKAKEIYELSGGYFDPTVMPLVNYWGFGYTPKKPVEKIDSSRVDSLMAFVGMQKVLLRKRADADFLLKEKPGVQLDFSALAKGYAVDEIGRLLKKKGIKNYLVEIGGELRAKGKNAKEKWWTVGINVPKETADVSDVQSVLELKNKSVATSGNYRNFYEVNGVKYSHTINPKTGFPERSNLLSVTVVADDCMTADALATTFMVMGLRKGEEWAKKLLDTTVYFIYNDENGQLKMKLFKNGKPAY